MRTSLVGAALAVASVLATVVAASPATAGTAPSHSSATACSTAWGSGDKQVIRESTSAPLVGIRAGQHACFDRLVLEVGARAPKAGFVVGYVKEIRSTADQVIPLRGAADLQISLFAPAYDAKGRSTYSPKKPREAVNVGGFRTFRQVAYVESFEAVTIVGLGVRARLPFRAFLVTERDRQKLVVDVAHRW